MNKRSVIVVLISLFLIALIMLSIISMKQSTDSRNIAEANSFSTQNAQTETVFSKTIHSLDLAATQTREIISIGITQTHSANINETEASFQLTNLVKTESIILTETAKPTSTITNTPIPPRTICQAKILQDTNVYSVPGGGTEAEMQVISQNTVIDIEGMLDDNGWLPISYGGEKGWIKNLPYLFEQIDENCEPTNLDIHYFLGIPGDALVFEDTFGQALHQWKTNEGIALEIVENKSYPESQLKVISKGSNLILSPDIPYIRNFTLITSYDRINHGDYSYIGIRYIQDENHFLSIRFLYDCTLQLYSENGLIYKKALQTGDNSCKDKQEDYLEVSLNDQRILEIKLNDSEIFQIKLNEDEISISSGYVVYDINAVDAYLSYLVIWTQE